ncbi:PTS sugar transporter subunit IIC [Liquorilactobacillus mali]|nr:PTS transporter subunit EIIC [Liquorilactobacillus mali]EJE99320.1 cellobiose PTS, EIIC [Liquorilactobacillus mali KCTC 3596 = DSM 20444]MDC7952658.1 PTS sugar transporter subunit IIC [Liquorilactobacillus mali]QFQ74650.1 PTS sugar transporter subunit IIC [Liquorilactobacillus mali]
MNKRLTNFLFKIDSSVEHRNYLLTVREAVTILFPFILVGIYVELLSNAIFHRHGFLNNIYHIDQWIPGFKIFSRYFTILNFSTNGVISVALTFLVAKIAVRKSSESELVAGITAAFSFMMMNFNRSVFGHVGHYETNHFLEGSLGYSGVFIAIIVGLTTGWIFNRFTPMNEQKNKSFKQNVSLARRTQKSIMPVLTTLILFAFLGCIASSLFKNGTAGLSSSPIQFSFIGDNWILGSAILAVALNNCLWLLGLISFFDFNNVNSSNMVQNLEYAIQHGSSWGAPNQISIHTLIDSFANIGGPGMALSLVIAIIWRSHNKDLRIIGKASFLPSAFNINQSLLMGAALLYNPLLIVPFLCTPVVSVLITWIALKFNFMPPSVYPVSETTPGFLAGWLGTGGAWQALLFSILNLIIAVVLYLPFVLLHDYFEDIREEGASNEN